VRPLETLTRVLSDSRSSPERLLELGEASEVDEVEAVRLALAERARQIKVLLEQTSRFAADAAHELRTPLTALRTELELMLEDAPSGDRKALERAVVRVERLGELVNRLLVLALPVRDSSAGFETVALTDVAESVILELPEHERARVRLEARAEGIVRGDSELLSSLLSNALGNALKFAAEGPIVLRIEQHAGDGVEKVVVEVLDCGPGIAPALRERAFEPFYRIRADASSGHGLGLALIGHIARVHGGHAEFVDAAQGAKLEIALPAWRPES
jgi:signal transduction histidine kinase